MALKVLRNPKIVTIVFFTLCMCCSCILYAQSGSNGSGIYRTNCEEALRRPQTDGFISYSKQKSMVYEIAMLKAEHYWPQSLIEVVGQRLLLFCNEDKILKKQIKQSLLTGEMLSALADSVVRNNLGAVDSLCHEFYELNEAQYVGYYVVEYNYKVFVANLLELAQANKQLPKDISAETAIRIARITEKIASKLRAN